MLIHGNSFRIPLRDNSVNCVVSSFPYFNLRSYDLEPIIIGGQADCQHEWGKLNPPGHPGQVNQTKWKDVDAVRDGQNADTGQLCHICGAFFGDFGLEPSIALHIANAVAVCREIKRILHPTGVFWLNYGDSYSTSRNGRSAADSKAAGSDDRTFRDKPFTVDEIPAKNLCLIPERIAIALQDDGWYVRSIAPWVKRNAMPSSVTDRPGTAHEVILMLTKSARYFFDMENVRRPNTLKERLKGREPDFAPHRHIPNGASFGNNNRAGGDGVGFHPNGRALRTSDFFFDSLDAYIHHLETVRDKGGMMLDDDGAPAAFVVNPRGYRFAHYATYPVELVSPMIRCSTSEKGICPKCGNPWIRVLDRPKTGRAETAHPMDDDYVNGKSTARSLAEKRQAYREMGMEGPPPTQPLGWRPSCNCNTGEPISAVILDPFCGSGAAGEAARELGRRFIGIDLSAKYLQENALPRSERLTSKTSLETLPLFELIEE